MGFSVAQQTEGNQVIMTVKGNVDEDAVFSAPVVPPGTSVTLDLEDVTAINSVGIREWIKWMKSFPSATQFVVRKCPKIIVDQINMVSGFLPPGTTVQSFYVPYYADESGSEKMVLFENGREFTSGKVSPPEDIKDESGEPMEMDVIEAKYFKFLNV